MTRIKRGPITQKKHKKLRKAVSGYRTSRRKSIKLARQAYMKALGYAYRDRRAKKRTFRNLWVTRINAAIQPLEMSYSQFMAKLKEKKIEIDRKVLAQLAHQHPDIFSALVGKLK